MRLGEMLYAARAPKDKCHDTSLVPDEVNAKANHANGKTKRKVYDKEMYKLQVELCRLQDWVKETGGRIIIVFEGRDAAGKGGTIKAITGEPGLRCLHFPTAKRPRCSCNATWSTSRQRARSSSLAVAGITEPWPLRVARAISRKPTSPHRHSRARCSSSPNDRKQEQAP
jgi:hypothetical protein